MRTFNNLFQINKYKPIIDELFIGYTKILIYQNLDQEDEMLFSARISLLFKLAMYDEHILLWFDNIGQMYQELNEYLELEKDNFIKIIVIIDYCKQFYDII